MQLKFRTAAQPQKITPPGPSPLPILGNLPLISQSRHVKLTNLAKEYGDIFQVHVFSRPVVVFNRLEAIRQALQKQQEEFAYRPNSLILKVAVNGRTIGGRDYSLLWKRHREIAVNALHKAFSGNLAFFEQFVINEAAELANIFLSYDGQPFDPTMDIGVSVANAHIGIFFGEKSDRDDPDCIGFIKGAPQVVANKVAAMADYLGPAGIFFAPFLLRNIGCVASFQRLIAKHFKAHRLSYDPNNLRNVTDALLKATSEVDESEKQTLNESLLVEGTIMELVSTGIQLIFGILRWAVLYAIAYPEIQAQIQQELDEVIGRERSVGLADRKQLPFTEAYMHELLRHAPIVPFGPLPHAAGNDTTINGYFIAKKTPIMINLYSLTRDERYWKEPEKFNPHRFLNENGQVREDLLDKYYPFGIGKRRCLGEHLSRFQLFLFFTNLMHKCKFEKVAGEQLRFNGKDGIVIHAEDYKVTVKPRF